MPVDVNNFLHSLCRYLATAAGVAYLTTPRELWRHQVNETNAADAAPVYSVLRIYGGPPLNHDPMPRVSVQAQTIGVSPDQTLARAMKLFEGLCDGNGHPLTRQTIDGYRAADNVADGTWRIIYVQFIQRPGIVGVDENNRQVAVFNCDVGFVKLS